MLKLIFSFSTKGGILYKKYKKLQENGHGKAIIYKTRKDKIYIVNRGRNII